MSSDCSSAGSIPVFTDLQAVKSAFGLKSEQHAICDSVSRARFAEREYEWLDVGVGDGSATLSMTTRLEKEGHRIRIIGVDPQLPDESQLSARQAILHKCGIEEFCLDRTYGVVNIRQSLYYVQDYALLLRKIARQIASPGVLVITHWTENCVLYLLHTEIAKSLQTKDVAFTSDQIITEIDGVDDCFSTRVTVHQGEFDKSRFAANEELKLALCRLCARRLCLDPLDRCTQLKIVGRFLEQDADFRRENAVITMTRCSNT